jgi:hypothetical protein
MTGIAELYELSEVKAGEPSPIMVFPVGDWTSEKYPKLTLDQELANEVIANFESDVMRRRVPVDTNHDPKSPANGWVDRVYMAPFEWQGVSGEALYADWVPNEEGARTVNAGEYAYDSLEIDDHVDPVTGARHHNVLKAVTLTNRPVLSMMPPVAEAGDALKLSEPVALQLSEVTAAEADDPMASLLSDLEAVLDKAGTTLKGKPGVRAIRTYLRETLAKASAHKIAAAEAGSTNDRRDELQEAVNELFGPVREGGFCVSDFGPTWVIYNAWGGGEDRYWRCEYEVTDQGITLGQPVEVKRETTYVSVSDGAPGAASPSSSQAVAMSEADEGTGAAASEATAAQKGVDHHMNAKALTILKLTEDAGDDATSAAVIALAEERDTAVKKLADRDVAEKAREFEAKLAEAMKPVKNKSGDEVIHILPAQKDLYMSLSEIDHDKAIDAIKLAMDGPGLKLGAVGSGSEGDADEEKPADVELAEKALAIEAERKLDPGAGIAIALAKDSNLAARYHNRMISK